MNRINPIKFMDGKALRKLSLNTRLQSFPSLQMHVTAIKAGYMEYIKEKGRVDRIKEVSIPEEIKEYLRAHYNSPPQDINYIKALRKESAPKCCPMCGSSHSGTLDHIMPKEEYTCFSIFSKNLVPACLCNSIRTSSVTGTAAGERILHPYYDDILKQRLISACFEDLGPVPKITLKILVPRTHPQYNAIKFHIDNIVGRTTILSFIKNQWILLMRSPRGIEKRLATNPKTIAKLRKILTEELDMQDERHDSKNNWWSVFISGLLDEAVLKWLADKFKRSGRSENAPLL